jgi:hypothetical protein
MIVFFFLLFLPLFSSVFNLYFTGTAFSDAAVSPTVRSATRLGS